jgi:hypothetical protein
VVRIRQANDHEITVFENASASAFPVATRLELVDKSCCGVSERIAIKWFDTLHFESRFSGTAAGCRELQSLPFVTNAGHDHLPSL